MQGIRACVFDAYGTLFDVASGVQQCGDVLGQRSAELAQRWRDKQLDYTWLRGLQRRHADFAQVTAEALAFALDSMGIDDAALQGRLLRLYDRLACYPEVQDCLRRLRRHGLVTAILSNGTPVMLASLAAAGGLDDLFDHLLSVEEVGVFKPDPRVYQLAVDRLDLAPEQILFLSSNGWDAHAASAFGLKVAWCNRGGLPPERLPGAPDAVIRSLAEVPGLLD